MPWQGLNSTEIMIMSNKTGVSDQIISLPKGGGAQKGLGETFKHDMFTGTGNFSVPIAIPSGRNGFQPQLTLTYSTGNGNGPFGLGWNLGIPCITRKTSKGIPQYQGNDTFILSGAEDLVLVKEESLNGITGRYFRPRIEGLFARIIHKTGKTINHWEIYTKDGLKSVYGYNSANRVYDQNNPEHIFQWLISQTEDLYGNRILYEYKSEDQAGLNKNPFEQNHKYNQVYLSNIFYINYKTQSCTNESFLAGVHFDYGEYPDADCELTNNPIPVQDWNYRPDPFSAYRAGFEIRTVRRCRRILVKVYDEGNEQTGQITKAYQLRYMDELSNQEMKEQKAPLNGISLLNSIILSGFQKDNSPVSMPPLLFKYSAFEPEKRKYEKFSAKGGYLPEYSLNNSEYELVDLHGNGLPDVIHTSSAGFRYWRNLGNCCFDMPRTMKMAPAGVTLAQPGVQFADMEGNGSADLLVTSATLNGYYSNNYDAQWSSFCKYSQSPSFDLKSADVKLVDMDGDGVIDVLHTGNNQFSIYYNRGKNGWDAKPQHVVRQSVDDFPDVYFSALDQRARLAAMSGDGLQDIVLIHDRCIEYWPNLGYGRWGKRIIMRNAPQLPNDYNVQRLFFNDIDGDGYADLIYVDNGKVHYWINQNGNGWSEEHIIYGTPSISDADAIRIVDMKGTGTAGILWTYDYSSNNKSNYKYLDLTGGIKPYLLNGINNNYGAVTNVHYSQSTHFALHDKEEGSPWLTKLPFPVQVVEKVETIDVIGKSRFVTRYSYHHGYYDGEEREFRGFGMVEQFDTEEFTILQKDNSLYAVDNNSPDSYLPPVYTKTWFHTGAFKEHTIISKQFEREYYIEPNLTPEQHQALLLKDTVLPLGLSAVEVKEACRALKGSLWRQEIYSLDNSSKSKHPYTVSERNYTVECLLHKDGNAHAVLSVHPRETVDYYYERTFTQQEIGMTQSAVADPRVTHQMVLKVDASGNIERSVIISYPRRVFTERMPEQAQTHIELTVNRYANYTDEYNWYRLGLPIENQLFEVVNFPEPDIICGLVKLFLFSEILTLTNEIFSPDFPVPSDAKICPFENWDWRSTQNGSNEIKLRPIAHEITLYRKNDLSGPLPFNNVESLALPFKNYKQILTPELLTKIYGDRINDILVQDEGRYVKVDGRKGWWVPSGDVYYFTDKCQPSAELQYARNHFFIVHSIIDPFGNRSIVNYDKYDFFPVQITNAVGDTIKAQIDYRVMSPRMVTDPNGNRREVVFDTFGMVVGTAVMGKVSENIGDSLVNFKTNLDSIDIDTFFADPESPNAALLLGNATTRIIYDMNNYYHSGDSLKPIRVAILSRETHASAPVPHDGLKIQVALSYSDGFGREIQKKIQAESGNVNKVWTESRWVGSGWTIFNNKGKPVKQYEPFFCTTHDFEYAKINGVSSTLFYDPLGRVISTLHPNHTYEKVTFDPWKKIIWDVNDTVLNNPVSDPDVKDWFCKLNQNEFLPTWYEQRINGEKGIAEKQAAEKTAVHAETPEVSNLDILGRPFLKIVDNGSAGKYSTRIEFDGEGKERVVIDAKGRVVMRYNYDMAGNKIHQSGMDAGERWSFISIDGKPVRGWDCRGFIRRITYDQLRRPDGLYITESGVERQAEMTTYGNSDSQAIEYNLLGKPVSLIDESGIVNYKTVNVNTAQSEAYDFKGNLLSSSRKIARDYLRKVEWPVVLDATEFETFTTSSTYDALNRPVTITTPDSSMYRPVFNKANLLEKVEVNLKGATEKTLFVKNINYNEKGQRTRIEYGSGAGVDHDGVVTTYEYDRATFRMTRMKTTRPLGVNGISSALFTKAEILQDLQYTYDPAGNITRIYDAALQVIHYDNQEISPVCEYTYDAIYRLVEAKGREHIGQTAYSSTNSNLRDYPFAGVTANPNDSQTLRNYTEQYQYDSVGNFEKMVHQATNGNWTRTYTCNEPSQTEVSKKNNRLTSCTVGNTIEDFTYDIHGNMTSMPHLHEMQWNYNDQLKMIDLQGGGMVYYVYDSAGQRVRKMHKHNDGLIEERIYLAGYEVYRKRRGTDVQLERQTLHIMDDKQRIALVETRTVGTDDSPAQLIRYQFGNHLGSASLETDEFANVISYEEYHPFGTTAFQAVNGEIKAAAKRYRYTGMEKDDESGLSCHGVRYYACWLGRWTSCDPAGIKDGLAIYTYVGNRPLNLNDPNGKEGEATQTTKPANVTDVKLYVQDYENTRQLPASRGYWPDKHDPKISGGPLNEKNPSNSFNCAAGAFFNMLKNAGILISDVSIERFYQWASVEHNYITANNWETMRTILKQDDTAISALVNKIAELEQYVKDGSSNYIRVNASQYKYEWKSKVSPSQIENLLKNGQHVFTGLTMSLEGKRIGYSNHHYAVLTGLVTESRVIKNTEYTFRDPLKVENLEKDPKIGLFLDPPLNLDSKPLLEGSGFAFDVVREERGADNYRAFINKTLRQKK
jgi:RHS repeat-associated protein